MAFVYETMIISQPPSASDLERLNPWECFSIVPWNGEYLLYLKRKVGLEEVRGILRRLQGWTEHEAEAYSAHNLHQLPAAE